MRSPVFKNDEEAINDILSILYNEGRYDNKSVDSLINDYEGSLNSRDVMRYLDKLCSTLWIEKNKDIANHPYRLSNRGMERISNYKNYSGYLRHEEMVAKQALRSENHERNIKNGYLIGSFLLAAVVAFVELKPTDSKLQMQKLESGIQLTQQRLDSLKQDVQRMQAYQSSLLKSNTAKKE